MAVAVVRRAIAGARCGEREMKWRRGRGVDRRRRCGEREMKWRRLVWDGEWSEGEDGLGLGFII
jgi:hypothetical protein